MPDLVVAAMIGDPVEIRPTRPPGWLGEWVRGDDGWRRSWLPLTPWIAVPMIVVALVAVPSRIVARLDDRWWQMRKRAEETVDAWGPTVTAVATPPLNGHRFASPVTAGNSTGTIAAYGCWPQGPARSLGSRNVRLARILRRGWGHSSTEIWPKGMPLAGSTGGPWRSRPLGLQCMAGSTPSTAGRAPG